MQERWQRPSFAKRRKQRPAPHLRHSALTLSILQAASASKGKKKKDKKRNRQAKGRNKQAPVDTSQSHRDAAVVAAAEHVKAEAKAKSGALLDHARDLPIAHFPVHPPDELARRTEADQALVEATAAEDLELIVCVIEAHSPYASHDAVPCILRVSLARGTHSCVVLDVRWLMLAACVAS